MLGILSLLGALQLGAPRDTVMISLEDAARRAVAVSSVVESAGGEVRRAAGLRAESGLPLAGNPAVGYSRVRRSGLAGTTYDHEWTVAQELEIAGQWSLRRSAASAFLRSNAARLEDSRRLAALDARRLYVGLSVAERRALLADSAASFAERLAEFARRQFEAGEMNRLELNAATLEAARARSAADRSAGEGQAAGAELARALALPGDSAVGTLPLPPVPDLTWASDTVLPPLARPRRADLRAAREAYQGAQDASRLAGRGWVPNLLVSVVGGRESDTDQLLGFGVGVSVPLLYRRQAARGAAAAELATAHAGLAASERTVLAELQSTAARYLRARAAERRFVREVLSAAGENIALTERALQEGEVGLTDVILLRRTALDAQVEYLDVLANSYLAWFDLAAAVGVEPGQLSATLSGTEQ